MTTKISGNAQWPDSAPWGPPSDDLVILQSLTAQRKMFLGEYRRYMAQKARSRVYSLPASHGQELRYRIKQLDRLINSYTGKVAVGKAS